MQQAAMNIRHDNSVMFPELYKVSSTSNQENENHSQSYFNEKATGLVTSLYDWEFFCNELEYE